MVLQRRAVATIIGGAVSVAIFSQEFGREKKAKQTSMLRYVLIAAVKSNKPGKISSGHGLSKEEVEDQIHDLKGVSLNNNSDVEACRNCGEVSPNWRWRPW